MTTIYNVLAAYFAKPENRDRWISSGEIQRVEWVTYTKHGKKKLITPATITRRLREMECGIDSADMPISPRHRIARSSNAGHAEYRYLPREWVPNYIPWASRTDKNTYWKKPLAQFRSTLPASPAHV